MARFFKLARTDSHGATIPLFTHQYAHMFDRKILIDHEKLIGSSNVGVCADAHLSLPLLLCTTSNWLPLAAFA